MSAEQPGTSKESRFTTATLAATAGLLIAHAILAWLIREPGITVRNDDALYLLLSRSLAGGHFNDAHLQGAPPHALYPPGFPATLLLLRGLVGERFDAFLALNVCFSTVALALTFDLVRRYWSVSVGLLVLLPLVVNNSLVRYAGSLISEPAYLCFSALTLWLVLRGPVDRRTLTLATLSLIVAGLTRSVGVVLLAAMVGWLLLERRWRAAVVVGLVGGLCIGGWLLRTFLLPPEFRTIGRSYAEDVERMVARGGGYWVYKRFKIGVLYASVHLPLSLPFPGMVEGSPLGAAWGWVMASIIPVGLVAMWRRRWRVVVLYIVGYVVLLAAWRMSSPRFLAVLLPLLVTALAVPFLGRFALRRPRLGWGIALVLMGMLTAGGLRGWWADWQQIRHCDRAHPLAGPGCFEPDARSFFRLAREAGRVVPPDGVVLAAREATFAYYSGRQTWYLNTAFTPDSVHILDGLLQRGVDYVLLGHTHTTEVKTLAPALAADCRRLDLLLREPPRSLLFRIRPPAEGEGDPAACIAIAAYRSDSTPVPRTRK